MITADDASGDKRSPSKPKPAAAARAEMQAERAALAAGRAEEMAAAFQGSHPGRWIVWVTWIATLCMSGAALAALVDTETFLGVYFAVSFGLFLLGAALFAVDIVLAAARSTTDEMGIGGLFFLAGSAPLGVQVSLNGSLGVAIVVSVATAVARLSTPELAFGTLAPVMQLSLTGLWGVRHGLFSRRANDSTEHG